MFNVDASQCLDALSLFRSFICILPDQKTMDFQCHPNAECSFIDVYNNIISSMLRMHPSPIVNRSSQRSSELAFTAPQSSQGLVYADIMQKGDFLEGHSSFETLIRADKKSALTYYLIKNKSEAGTNAIDNFGEHLSAVVFSADGTKEEAQVLVDGILESTGGFGILVSDDTQDNVLVDSTEVAERWRLRLQNEVVLPVVNTGGEKVLVEEECRKNPKRMVSPDDIVRHRQALAR
ncbi:hypothetical protein M422DRAFT_250599 [Sphaerobolus stellatus SS14]|uniref:Uncharacterized protein n=1 Tax=Sphaerobolus stellatus (strain SS14) TaxID=990650 RepID=A0A0C9USJ4_SPHS4|nr:hypothetical protein M422DRAFT_250599 [Sphaerobolus stellatus SS14]